METFFVDPSDFEPTLIDNESFSKEPEGLLKTKDKERRLFAYRDTSQTSRGASRFIENSAKERLEYKPKDKELLSKRFVNPLEEETAKIEQPFISNKESIASKKLQKHQEKKFQEVVQHARSFSSYLPNEKRIETKLLEPAFHPKKMYSELPKIKITALKYFVKTLETKPTLFSLAKTVGRKSSSFAKSKSQEQTSSLTQSSTRFSHSQMIHHFKNKEKDPDQGQQERQEQPKETIFKKKKKVRVISLDGTKKVTVGSLPVMAGKISSFTPSKLQFREKIENSVTPMQKEVMEGPMLQMPRLGMIPTYYVLTKLGIISDSSGMQANKEEMDVLNQERDKLHQERMQELTKAQKDARAKKRWGVAMQIMHWLIAFTGLITGIGLLISGTAVLAGSLMVAGGVLAVTNQIMNAAGVWDKIVEKLPGQDPEKKRAVVMWMQVGISILAMVLMGGASMFGGFSKTFQIMGTITSMQSAGLTIGYSICMLGMSLTQSKHKARLAELKGRELLQKKNEHRHQDVMDDVKRQQEVHEQLMESLAKWLETQQRNFRATQAGLTR